MGSPRSGSGAPSQLSPRGGGEQRPHAGPGACAPRASPPSPSSQGPPAVASESQPCLCSARRAAVGPTWPAQGAPEGWPAVTCPIAQQRSVGSPASTPAREDTGKAAVRSRADAAPGTPPTPRHPFPAGTAGGQERSRLRGGAARGPPPPCRPGPLAPTRLRAGLELSAPDGVLPSCQLPLPGTLTERRD